METCRHSAILVSLIGVQSVLSKMLSEDPSDCHGAVSVLLIIGKRLINEEMIGILMWKEMKLSDEVRRVV